MKRYGLGTSLVGCYLKVPRVGVAADDKWFSGHEKVTNESCWLVTDGDWLVSRLAVDCCPVQKLGFRIY